MDNIDITRAYNKTSKIYRTNVNDKFKKLVEIEGNGFVRHNLRAEKMIDTRSTIVLSKLVQCYITINDIFIVQEPIEVVLYNSHNVDTKIHFNTFDKIDGLYKISMWNCGLLSVLYDSYWMIDIILLESGNNLIIVDFSSSCYDQSTCDDVYKHSQCSHTGAHDIFRYSSFRHHVHDDLYIVQAHGISGIVHFPEKMSNVYIIDPRSH